MKNLWDDTGAELWTGDLGKCVYGSRLLGLDPALVLHGGGNTSVKTTGLDIHGENIEILHVKGSGWDLATIEEAGFAPLRLQPVQKLAELESLTDLEMVNQLRINLLDASAPNPSVEAILHASLPYTAVQHTHADAVLALTNNARSEQIIQDLWGVKAVVVPYVMPGFDLAKVCAREFQRQVNNETVAMVLMNHGIFTFASTTKEAYTNMINLITEAEEYLFQNSSIDITASVAHKLPTNRLTDAQAHAELRSKISVAAGKALLLARTDNEASDTFAQRTDLHKIAEQGPATPDHIIRTKQFPMIGQDVRKFAEKYHEYFLRNAARFPSVNELDPGPRVILDSGLGLLTAGNCATDCQIASDIYLHTIDVITAAEGLGGFVALKEADLFEVEYWELEQAKLKKAGPALTLTGEVALVTGAASGIGRACCKSLLDQGAAVIGFDLNSDVESIFSGDDWLGLTGNVTDPDSIKGAIDKAVQKFGGIDILVNAAGIFGESAPIASINDDEWNNTISINLDGVLNLLRACHPFLKLSYNGGRVVLIGSKNVIAPGKSAGAYSASKAAVTQLGRVAALEWADDGIIVNTIHPDGVFDTGLWNDQLIKERAANYGLTSDEYRTRNLLGREITSADIGALVTALTGSTFSKMTGAQIAVDGGSDRVI